MTSILGARRAGPTLVLAGLTLAGVIALASVLLVGPPPISQPYLVDSLLPPAWLAAGGSLHSLGTDAQGRDMLATTLSALRLSVAVATLGVSGAMLLGVVIGLVAGQAGGFVDAAAMRAADAQMSFPALLVALLADAVLRFQGETGGDAQAGVGRTTLIIGAAIALGRWPPIARLVRAATRREWRRDYVAASRLAGASVGRVLLLHVAPNVMGSILSLVALDFGLAVTDESTLSYLGLGLPADQPSLGTLIRSGQSLMLSGAWWVIAVPGAVMVILVAVATASAESLLSRAAHRSA